MLSVDVGSIVRFLFNVCRQPPSESRAGGGSQPTGVRGAGFQMQSQSRRGFVPEAELWPNPNPGFPGRSRGLQGTARRALPPASAAGLGCPADGPSPWQGHGSTEFVAGGTRGDALWCPLWLRGGGQAHLPLLQLPPAFIARSLSAPSAGAGVTGDQVPAETLTGGQPASCKPRWACRVRVLPSSAGRGSWEACQSRGEGSCLPGD